MTASKLTEMITPEHPWWPPQLADLTDPPVQLWVTGDVSLLTSPMLAAVGSRANTSYGQQVAPDIVGGTSGSYVTVSGGAFGIDTVAHRMALANGHQTVVVQPAGLDHLYPAANRELFTRIVETGGLIVSEYSPETVTGRDRFLARNRIIAALSVGVVVIEAGRRSGTLNTARHAKELGRPVMAVPGPVTSALSIGCHMLLKDGCHLVTDAADVLAVLQGHR